MRRTFKVSAIAIVRILSIVLEIFCISFTFFVLFCMVPNGPALSLASTDLMLRNQIVVEVRIPL
jgi:hypothetical protein